MKNYLISFTGDTILHHAIKSGHVIVVQWIVDTHPKLLKMKTKTNSVLELAAENGKLDVLKVLVQHGCSPLDLDRKGKFPRGIHFLH